MSRVDHWRISSRRNSNRIKSGTLGNLRHKVHKISDRYPTKGISQFHKLEWNNKRKMAGKPMLRRVHMQYGKQIIRIMEAKIMKIKFMESIDDVHILHFAEANDVAFVPNDPDTGSSEIVICSGDRLFIIPLCDEAFSHLMEMSDGIHMDYSGYLAIDAKNYYSNARFNAIKQHNYAVWDGFKEEVSKDAK